MRTGKDDMRKIWDAVKALFTTRRDSQELQMLKSISARYARLDVELRALKQRREEMEKQREDLVLSELRKAKETMESAKKTREANRRELDELADSLRQMGNEMVRAQVEAESAAQLAKMESMVPKMIDGLDPIKQLKNFAEAEREGSSPPPEDAAAKPPPKTGSTDSS